LKAIVGILGLHLNRMAAPTATTAHAPRTISPHSPSRASVANRRWAHHGTAFGARYLSVCLSACLIQSICIHVCPLASTETRHAHTKTHSHARARTHTLLHVLPEAQARAHTRTKQLSPSRAFVCLLYLFTCMYFCMYMTRYYSPTSRLDKQDRNASA
jgi:hypothetical protein